MNKQDKINAILVSHGKPPLSKKRCDVLQNYQKDELIETKIDGYFYYPTANCMVSSYLCDNYSNKEIKINGNMYYFRKQGKDFEHVINETITPLITKEPIKIESQLPQSLQSQQLSHLQLYKPKPSQQNKYENLVEHFTKKRTETLKKNNIKYLNTDELGRTLIRTNEKGYFYYPQEDCMVVSDDLVSFVMKKKGRDNICRMDVVAEHEWLKAYLNRKIERKTE